MAVEKPGMEGLKSSLVIPPTSVVDRVLKELFQNGMFFISTKGARLNNRKLHPETTSISRNEKHI